MGHPLRGLGSGAEGEEGRAGLGLATGFLATGFFLAMGFLAMGFLAIGFFAGA